MLSIRNLIVELQNELGEKAGLDPARDRFLCGYILACQDFLKTDIEE